MGHLNKFASCSFVSAALYFTLLMGLPIPSLAQLNEQEEAELQIQEPARASLGTNTGNNAGTTTAAAGQAVGGTGGETETTSLVPGGFITRVQSAGDGFDDPYGIWFGYSHSRFEDDFAATAFDGDSDTVYLGADFSPWDNYVFGVALSYDTTDIDTTFNGGQAELDSFSVIPYMGINLSEALDSDLNVNMIMTTGYSTVDVDQFRLAAGARVTSSTSADRFFWAGEVNAGQQIDDFYVSGRVNVLYAVDDMQGSPTAPVTRLEIFVQSLDG